MNVKTGKATMKGYVVSTNPNGDKLFARTEGQLIGNGQAEGTFSYVGGSASYTLPARLSPQHLSAGNVIGTGRLEGVTGSGVWKSKSLALGIFCLEMEGEREIPGK